MMTARFPVPQFATALLLVLLSLWAATQWVAWMLGFQAALGASWVDLFGWPVYAPWQLFPWWLAFDAQAPDVFARAGVVAALGGMLSGAVAIGGAARRASHSQAITTYGSARWADNRDVAASGLLGRSGVILGLYGDRYLRHDGPEHILAVAPTRSGKGVGLVVPTLMTWTGSAVIHDVKGENWQLTAGWRAKFSHCLLFDPTNPQSARFNPLLEVRKGPMEVRDVQNIADILVDPEGARERHDHWEKTAHALLVGAILHVLYAESEKTLARVASFLADPSRSISRALKIMLATNHLGLDDAPKVHPVVASVARELLNKSDNERSGVVSTAMSCLGLYRDPVIAANTARSDWRIADLVTAERPVSLYLVVPPSDISRTRPLVRLILNQIGRRLTESLGSLDGHARRHQLLLMLDEFPALGRLDFFETALAFLAGYGVRAVLVAQSLHQIDKAYGPNHAILDNCHVRVAFAPNDERTAKRLSDALGTATQLRAQTQPIRQALVGVAVAYLDFEPGNAAAAADGGRDTAVAAGRRSGAGLRHAADPRQEAAVLQGSQFSGALPARAAAGRRPLRRCPASARRRLGRAQPNDRSSAGEGLVGLGDDRDRRRGSPQGARFAQAKSATGPPSRPAAVRGPRARTRG